MGILKFNKIRILETGFNPGPWNMALDEVLLNRCNDGNEPILRLYGWYPPCVSIGYFQSIHGEVNLDRCRDLGVDVVRRMTGGGAVLHEFEITYSFITKKFPLNMLNSYKLICEPVTDCINKLGFKAEYVPLNDIMVENKKVSGNAQTRKNKTLLQHGTVLLNVDFDKMFSVLKVPQEKLKDKMISDAKLRVNGLNRTFEEVASQLKNSFSEKFSAQTTEDEITEIEKEDCKKKIAQKYSSDKWNHRR